VFEIATDAELIESAPAGNPTGAFFPSQRWRSPAERCRRTGPAVDAQHVGELLQRFGNHPVIHPGAAPLTGEEPRIAQHLQMMRDGGLSYLDRYRDVAYTRLAAAVAGNHTE